MKMPAVSKPFVFDSDAPLSRLYGLAGLSFLYSALLLSGGIYGLVHNIRELVFGSWLGAIASWLGFALILIGRLVRSTQKDQSEMTKRLTEQDERIRQLEAQLAALSTPSPTP